MTRSRNVTAAIMPDRWEASLTAGQQRVPRSGTPQASQVRDRLRALNGPLSLLNHVVGVRLALRDVDLDCLDLVQRHGPPSPGELARRSGVHPVTMTGILDRLQRAGWIVRERDPQASDRRAVTVQARRDRAGEIYRLYAGMCTAMDEICARYDERQLELLVDFLDRVAAAGHPATTELSVRGDGTTPP